VREIEDLDQPVTRRDLLGAVTLIISAIDSKRVTRGGREFLKLEPADCVEGVYQAL
jgi:hypothetical protein